MERSVNACPVPSFPAAPARTPSSTWSLLPRTPALAPPPPQTRIHPGHQAFMSESVFNIKCSMLFKIDSFFRFSFLDIE